MNKPIHERIKQVMDDMEINQVEMAKLAGVTKGRVNQWLNGTYGSGMSAEAAFRLADKTRFNARWLATGDGPERDPLAANHRVRDLIDNYAKLDERGRQHVLTVAEREASYGAEDSACWTTPFSASSCWSSTFCRQPAPTAESTRAAAPSFSSTW